MTQEQHSTIERIKTLLRRDLKLDPNAAMPDDMPLIGGKLDLDSLDVLLVITTMEKEFGFKAPLDGSAREIFKSITTLANYLDAHVKAPLISNSAQAPVRSLSASLERLPHREPFRFLTQLHSLAEGVSGRGDWKLTGTEAFFAGHFPGDPIVPGVLLTEALAQLSGIVAGIDSVAAGRLAQVNIRFHSSARPPVVINLESRLMRSINGLCDFEVSASVGDEKVANGTLTLKLISEASTAAGAKV